MILFSAIRYQVLFRSVVVRILRRMDSIMIGVRLLQGLSIFFGVYFRSASSIQVSISLERSPVSAVVLYMSAITLCTFSSGCFTKSALKSSIFFFFLIVDTKAMKRWIRKKGSDEYLKIINNSFGQLDHTIEFVELFWVWFSIITLCRWLSYPSFLLRYLSVNVFFTFITWSKLWNRLKMTYDFITL